MFDPEDVVRKAHDDTGADSASSSVCDGQSPNHIQFVEPLTANANKDVAFHKAYALRGGVIIKQKRRFPKEIRTFAREAASLPTAMKVIEDVSAQGKAAMILGALRINDPIVEEAIRSGRPIQRTLIKKDGQYPYFQEKPRHFFMADFDCNDRVEGYPEGYDEWCEKRGLDVFADPEGAVRAVVDAFFPEIFKTTSFGYQLSAGAGIGKDGKLKPSRVKFHAFFRTTNPVMPSDVKEWINAHNDLFKRTYGKHAIDPAFYTVVQPHFISVHFDGGPDPLDGKRFGFVKGDVDTLAFEPGQSQLREIDEDGRRLDTMVIVRGFFVGNALTRTFVPRCQQSGSRDYARWPRNWRECLTRHGEQGSGHDSLKFATLELAKEIAARGIGHLDVAAIEPYRAEFNAVIDASYRTAAEKRELRDEVVRYFAGAVDWVRAWRASLDERKQLLKAPTYPDRCVSLAEAAAATEASILHWMDGAREWAEANAKNQAEQEAFDAEWEAIAARERELDPMWEMPKERKWERPIYFPANPQLALAVGVGVGKTHYTLKAILRPGFHDTYRINFIVPNHEKAEEIKREYLDIAKKLGVRTTTPRIFMGLNKLCKADEPLRGLAAAAAADGLSVFHSVCKVCPLAGECEWLAQRTDVGPGLKIFVTAYLGTGLPTYGGRGPSVWLADEEEGRAPMLGTVIDEAFHDALRRDTLVTPDDMQHAGEIPKMCASKDDEYLLRAGIGHLRSAMRTPGVLKRPFFNRLFDPAPGEGRAMKVDRICSILEGLKWDLRSKLSDAMRKEIESGDVKGDAVGRRKLRLVKTLIEVFEILASSRETKSGEIDAARVVETDGKISGLRLFYYARVPSTVSCAPALILDATAHDRATPYPFDLRDDFHGEDVPADIEIRRIQVRADNQYTLKVLDAPFQRGKFNPDTVKVKGEDGKEELVASKRLRSDADWSALFRVVDAICGRVIADGGTAGFISYKAVREYVKDMRLLPKVILGHFGKMRGSNAWKEVSALVVVGRKTLFDPKMVEEAAAYYALAAPRELDGELVVPSVDRNAGIDHRAEGVLRVLGPDKSSLERGITCKTEVPACPWVRAYYEWNTLGEAVQALGRARGAQRSAADPVLVVDISNTVIDGSYDAVVTWDAFQRMTELDVLMHAKSVVNCRPAHLKALLPSLFYGDAEVRDTARRLFERWGVTKNVETGMSPFKRTPKASLPILSKGIIPLSTKNVTDAARSATRPLFTADTTLYGDPGAHPLLKPAQITTALYQPGRVQYGCYVDRNRRAQASAAQRAAVGVELLPEDAPPSKPKKPPMTAAERQRKRRAKLKAAKAVKTLVA